MDIKFPPSMLNHPLMLKRTRMLEDGQFIRLNNDEERARLIIDKHIEIGFVDDDREPEKKSSEESRKYRVLANKAFMTNLTPLQSILDLYCKSIVHAPPGSKELALSYANRSAVLFKAKFYEDCLIDIERALSTGYPEELKAKLFSRRAKCLYALKGEIDAGVNAALIDARKAVKELDINDQNRRMADTILREVTEIASVDRRVRKFIPKSYIPELSEENPKLPGASASIALKYSEKYGRHVVATRHIKPGELLMIQKPFVTMVFDESFYNLCEYCNKQTWTGIPCNECVHVMYCSEDCKQAAWRESHDVECPVLAKAKAVHLSKYSSMSIRMTIKALREAGSFEALQKRLKELDSVKDNERIVEFSCKSDSYDMVYILNDRSDKKQPFEMLHWTLNGISIAFHLATKTDFFGEKMPCDITKLRDNKWFAFAAGLTTRNMKIAAVNHLEVPCNIKETNSTDIYMLVALHSFFNHNCYSRTKMSGHGQFEGLMAVAPVEEGEQVFICYNDHHFLREPKQVRQSWLQRFHHFTCDCLACTEDWTESSCIRYDEQRLSLEVHKMLTACYESVDCKLDFRSQTHENLLKRIAVLGEVIEKFHQHVFMPCEDLFIMSGAMAVFYDCLSDRHIRLE